MYKLFPLPILLLLLTFHVKASGYNVVIYAQRDTVPLVTIPKVTLPPQPGLLKKLAEALQFRKNARAREQARVLDIIARSGLKDSLETAITRLNAIDSAGRTQAENKERSDIGNVLAAIKELQDRLAAQEAADSSETDEGTGSGKLSGDDQAIQEMVSKMVSPLNPAEQQNLALIRQLLLKPQPLTNTVKESDSLSEQYTYRVHSRLAIIGFYPFPTKEQNRNPDLRLIDEVAWYSAGFDGLTGKLTGRDDWRTSPGLDSARVKGCAVSLCVQSQNEKNIASLLRSPAAKQVLIEDIVSALKIRHADGVNILFDKLSAGSADSLSAFILSLSDALKGSGRSYRLGLRIPAYAPDNLYDLPVLNEHVDRFLVDFTAYQPGVPGPLAPLAGVRNNDLKTCLSRYLKIPIPPSKLVACLPYFGIGWTLQSGHWLDSEPIPYSDLRSKAEYQQLPVYDPVSATQRLEIRNKAGVLIRQVWYDDDVTLAAKFDFIRQNRLGGIVIRSLGDDGSYGELWDVMAAKLAGVDTTIVALRSSRKQPAVLDDWQWSWPYVNAKLEQYGFLFAYPCETSFPKVLVNKWEQAGVKNNDRNMIRKEEAILFGVLSILLALLFAGGGFLLINRMRRVGDRWKGTKPLAGLLLVLFIALTITVFMFLFLDTRMVYFGVSDNAADCLDFPLGMLFIVIFSGIAIGVLMTRFLLFRLMKKDDIP